jgi:hypothetical protein
MVPFLLQSCVDSGHSTGTLFDHCRILWKPFSTIVQIMNDITPFHTQLEAWYHGMIYDVLRSVQHLAFSSKKGMFSKYLPPEVEKMVKAKDL